MSKEITIIGLTGYAGVGKDTVRTVLEELHGYQGFAFADPLRAMIEALFKTSGISMRYMTSRSAKEIEIPALGISYRHLAQTLGTEWGRGLDKNFWLDSATGHLVDLLRTGTGSHFVVSDVRFENEADWVHAHGGVIWSVQRTHAPLVRDHVSETGIDAIKPDWTIDNNGTLAQLQSQVAEAVAALELAPT